MGKRRLVVQAKEQERRKPHVFPWRQYLPIVAVLLLTAAVYAQVRGFGFMPVDDAVYVSGNGYVRNGPTAQSLLWALTSREVFNWHPLTWLSHMLDCRFYGLDAGKHHITSLLFHLANTLLLFIALKRMTGAVWRSTFVAALFALHPLHVESVAWIAERKDVLSTFFWMLTVLAYAYYAEKPKISRYVLVAIAFALGLMAKPMLVSLPVVLLLLDYWPLRRSDAGWKRLVLEKTPLFALSLGSCVMTFIAQRGGGAVGELNAYPLTVRIANSLFAYADYLAKMVVPINLSPMYPHPGSNLPAWTVVAPGAILFALTTASIAMRRRAPHLIVGWLIYLISLLPVIGLVQVGLQGMADRYTYIPLIGVFIAIAWIVPETLRGLLQRNGPVVLGTAGTLTILVLSVAAANQAGTWKNGGSYIRQMLRATQDSELARSQQADYLNQIGRPVEAEAKMAAVVRDYPRLARARISHASTLSILRRFKEANSELREAVRLNPRSAAAYSYFGLSYLDTGMPTEALKWCRKAVNMAPDTAQWHVNLARVLAALRRPDEAISEYRRALETRPDTPTAERDLGVLLYLKQDTVGGVEHLRRAVLNDPNEPMSQFLLGAALRRAGENEQAIDHLSEAVRLQPTMADAHGELAMALDGAGRNEEARAELEIARKLGANVVPPPVKP